MSLGLHIVLIGLFMLSFDFSPRKTRMVQPRRIVEAVVVDEQAIATEIQRLKAEEEEVRLLDKRRVEEAERKAAAALKRREAEERRLRELETERKRQLKNLESEKERLNEQLRKEKDRVAEQRRLVENEKNQAEAARKRREEERLEAEQKRLEQALREDLAAEEKAVREASDVSEIDRYQAAIRARIQQSFTILPGLDGLSCILRITLIPGGEVLTVEVSQSSGNTTFDRQAETAVRKAAPLPVPSEPRLFNKMRTITFVFDPQI